MPPENNELERIISEIRNEPIDPAVVEQAAARVWERLAHAPLRSCADFQALMPDYRAGRLPEARALLLKDHTHECVACRKALEGRKVVAFPTEKRRVFSMPYVRWAVAAALALGVGVSAWQLMLRLSPSKTVIEAVNGTVFSASSQGTQTVAAGAELSGGEVRTARDSTAMVRLGDGSLVEVAERSAFTVSRGGKRFDNPPRAWQRNRTGGQAPLRPPLRGHTRLPRGGHRDRVQRGERHQGVARFRGRRRGPRGAGQ